MIPGRAQKVSDYRAHRIGHAFRQFLALWLALLLCALPSPAFDTFWHSAATSAATRQLGFTDDSTNIVQFGNFGPDYFAPLFDRLGTHLEGTPPKATQTLQDFDAYRAGQQLSVARKYADFLHFDNIQCEKCGPQDGNWRLDANWKFDYLFLRLLRNTQAAVKNFYGRSEPSERRRQILILMTLGGSLHMVQDFYSHSNWIHQDFPHLGMPLVRMPWGKDRAPTWFEVRAKLGDPNKWPFRVNSGIYPPSAVDQPNTHTHMNHDNSQLFYDGKSQVGYHGQGPVPATPDNPQSIAEHQLFAVNTAAGASMEWIQKLEEDSDVKQAIDSAKGIKLARNDPMVPFLTSALGSTLFLSCLVNKWDGDHPPARRQTECHGIYTSLVAPSPGAAVGLPPLVGPASSMPPTPANEFWAMHVQFNLMLDLAGGFASQNGYYVFDSKWWEANSR